MRLNNKRPPRPQSSDYKMMKREDWEKLHFNTYTMMVRIQHDIDCGNWEPYDVEWERFLKEWRKHIALPTDCETWLEDRRNARANEPI